MVNRESLLFHADFRRLCIGDAISQVGTMVTMPAMPLLAVKVLHATPFQVGLLTTFEFLTFLVIGLPAGAWVDRMRRRSVMITADLGRVVTLGSVPVVGAFGGADDLAAVRLLGRMNATMRFLVWGTMPIGGLLGGTLGSTIGVRRTLLVTAAGGCLSFLWVYLSPLRRMRELPTRTEAMMST